jgi:hypothetical protein
MQKRRIDALNHNMTYLEEGAKYVQGLLDNYTPTITSDILKYRLKQSVIEQLTEDNRLFTLSYITTRTPYDPIIKRIMPNLLQCQLGSKSGVLGSVCAISGGKTRKEKKHKYKTRKYKTRRGKTRRVKLRK